MYKKRGQTSLVKGPTSQLLIFVTLLLAVGIGISFGHYSAALGQTRGGRSTPTPTSTPKPTPTSTPKQPSRVYTPVKPVVRPGALNLAVPFGSQVWLNGDEVLLQSSGKPIKLNGQSVITIYATDSSTLTIKNLKPGQYRLQGKKADYEEYLETVELKSDETANASVNLKPILSTLTIKPAVNETFLEVWSLDSNQKIGTYKHQLQRLEVSPGKYQIRVSKEGYFSIEREVALKAGQAFDWEPGLEQVPPPTPTPTPAPRIARISTTFTITSEGKTLLFKIRSASGEFNVNVGTIAVRASANGNVAEGSLNGMPCQVEFVKLENISEGSIVEAPSPFNQWATVAVRVRPKDPKRPVNFAVNWRSVVADLAPPTSTDLFVPAQIIEKIKPNFPQAAKSSRATGVVSVLVVVDRYGLIASAKAIDGPFVFRQAAEEAARRWKFQPATRNGIPVESEQTIQFTFTN
jgi:TonB family protein